MVNQRILKTIYFRKITEYISLIFFILLIIYLIFSNNAENLYKQAFKNNINAFRNGVYLANIRFLTNNPNRNQINQWLSKKQGLDFNPQGFPIGTDITDVTQIKPMSLLNCQQVWQFVLGPLQPNLSLLSNDKEWYWVGFSDNGDCVYHPNKPLDSYAVYHPVSGRVFLKE